MIKIGIIISSDKGFSGEREDKSEKVFRDFFEDKKFIIKKVSILPDEKEMLEKEMLYMCDDLKVDLLLTTGGTGFSKRDVTPEATMNIINRQAMGIAEAIRSFSMQITPRAMLSRAVSGIRNETVIVNLPGNPKAVGEILEYITESLIHGIEILKGQTGECAQKSI